MTFMAGIWDIAAVAVIVEEAGGRFSDVWGGRALDTTTSVLSNGHLGAQLLAIAAPHLPAEPDEVVWINRPPMPTRAS